jgi:hypothetical protein
LPIATKADPLHLEANAARFASFTIDGLPLSPVTNSPTGEALFLRGPERPILSDYEELPGDERTLPKKAASGQYRACFRTARASCAAHPVRFQKSAAYGEQRFILPVRTR